MAEVFWIGGVSEYVNRGEQRVVEHLQKVLPSDFVLIPNITIPYELPGTPEEHDVIVVGPDAVFVVETKDFAGDVEFTEQLLVINGEERRNPYNQTRIKAQKLSSQLKKKLPWFAHGGWVDHVVALAQTPRSLRIDPSMINRVMEFGDLPTVIGPKTPLINPKHHGQLNGRTADIVAAVTGGASKRNRANIFGRFNGGSMMIEQGGFSAWRGTDPLTGESVILEVHAQPHGLDAKGFEAWKADKLKLHSLMREIGMSADIDGPRDVFSLDNGSIVSVWPDRELPLTHFLAGMNERRERLHIESARRLVAGFASALRHLHSGGWVLGSIPDHNISVRGNGRGAFVIGGQLPAKSADTEADLRFLGQLIERITAFVDDRVLEDLAANLRTKNPIDLPSIAFVLMALEDPTVLGRNRRVAERNHLERFEIGRTLATHAHGATVAAFDKTLSRNVLLKYESGRPAGDWVLREYRVLTHPKLVANDNVARALAGQSEDGLSYLATEFVDAVTLASALDSGALATPEHVRAVILRLLQAVDGFHPDTEATIQLLETAKGVMSEEQEFRLAELRDAGVAHNLIGTSNVFFHESRGVVLVDFTRAGRFGEVIPARRPEFWPPDLPQNISDPRADLFAIGSILGLLLDRISTSVKPEERELFDRLRLIAVRATAETADERFLSARRFIDALGGASAVALPEPPVDVWKLQQKIDSLVAELNFEEALALCPSTWEETRRSIQRKAALVATEGTLLLDIDGVTLRHAGQTVIPPGMTSKNEKHEGGTAEVYVVSEPSGGHFEIHVASAVIDGETQEWVGVAQAVAAPPQLQHAARSLRITVASLPGGRKWMELRQARLRRDAKFENQATKIKATEDMLQIPLADESVRDIFSRFGSVAFGTREQVYGDTSKSRTYLAVAFDDAPHLPAVAHFITRIMPLYRGLEDG